MTVTLVGTPDVPVSMETLRGSIGSASIVRVTLSGEDVAVRDLALALAGPFHLSVPRASLAAEALAIADGSPPVPRRLGAPQSFDDPTVAAAFGNAIGHFTDVVLHFAPLATANGPDTEPVHQMRVAVRRTRSAIAVFRDAVACPDVAAVVQDLKGLGAVLGPARDWDVFVTETLVRVTAAFPDDARLRRMAKAAEHQRDVSHAALRDWLASPAFRELGIRLAWLCGSPRWHATLKPEALTASRLAPAAFAAHVLQRRWKKVTAAGKSIEALDVLSLHALRLRAKRARYAIEILMPGDNIGLARRLLRRLSGLQQHLGTLNDGAVAATMLGHLGGPAGRHGYATGLVLGFLAASAENVRPRILRAWKKFRRTKRFWA
jgi:CHAD domain-containing protein